MSENLRCCVIQKSPRGSINTFKVYAAIYKNTTSRSLFPTSSEYLKFHQMFIIGFSEKVALQQTSQNLLFGLHFICSAKFVRTKRGSTSLSSVISISLRKVRIIQLCTLYAMEVAHLLSFSFIQVRSWKLMQGLFYFHISKIFYVYITCL